MCLSLAILLYALSKSDDAMSLKYNLRIIQITFTVLKPKICNVILTFVRDSLSTKGNPISKQNFNFRAPLPPQMVIKMRNTVERRVRQSQVALPAVYRSRTCTRPQFANGKPSKQTSRRGTAGVASSSSSSATPKARKTASAR